jgi:hypothetical protein
MDKSELVFYQLGSSIRWGHKKLSLACLGLWQGRQNFFLTLVV